MKIQNLKINHMNNPLGFLMEEVVVSWNVSDAKGTYTKSGTISLSEDEDFTTILVSKTGELNSAGEKLEIDLKSRTRYYVRVEIEDEKGDSAFEDTWFETGKREEKWKGKWISPRKEDDFHPEFVKEFHLDKPVTKARLYISGLGLYEAFINEKRVGEEYLNPNYSDYHHQIQVQTYDVTEYLNEDNEIHIFLGNGWYKGHFGFRGDAQNWGDRFHLIAELHVVFEDGTSMIINTDKTWKYRASKFEMTDIYNGEIYNGLIDCGEWKDPVICKPEGALIDRYSLPVKRQEEFEIKEIIHTPAGETVLDFGQNFAGIVSFEDTSEKRNTIKLDFGEILQNGNFYNANYRTAKAEYIYISDGIPKTVYPHFTFYGFRYVRVTGDVDLETFKGIALYSDMKEISEIKTDNAMLSQLISNVRWGLKSNSVDLPTDCPQRDERMGWTGDAQVFSSTASYLMDTSAFYDKFIHDLRTAQIQYDGIVPAVIPVLDGEPISSCVWGDIAAFLPTVLYEHYGDIHALRRYYPMMKDWVDYVKRQDEARGAKYLWDFGFHFADWLALDGRTDQSVMGATDPYFIASCYWAQSAKYTSEAAKLLGYKEDAKTYFDLYKKIKRAILKEFFTRSGRLCIDTQTAYITALNFGIYKDHDLTKKAFENRLYKDCYKIKGGFVGAPQLCRILSEQGMDEVALYFLLQEEYPGWMHCINLGATTVWERWNSVLDDGMISGISMNSLNHYAYGTVLQYVIEHIAGIKAMKPGFKKALIKPYITPRIGSMKIELDTPYGEYEIEWEIKEDGTVEVEVEVPFDGNAHLELPGLDPMELGPGEYEYTLDLNMDIHARYHNMTFMKELWEDAEAMEIIQKYSPVIYGKMRDKDLDFLNDTLGSLLPMPFAGIFEEDVMHIKEDILNLKDNK